MRMYIFYLGREKPKWTASTNIPCMHSRQIYINSRLFFILMKKFVKHEVMFTVSLWLYDFHAFALSIGLYVMIQLIIYLLYNVVRFYETFGV